MTSKKYVTLNNEPHCVNYSRNFCLIILTKVTLREQAEEKCFLLNPQQVYIHCVVIRKSHLYYVLKLKWFWKLWHNGSCSDIRCHVTVWFSVAHLCSNTVAGNSDFSPPPRNSVCLLYLASTSDLHMNMLCTRNTGPVTACLAPCASSQASPK